MNKQEINESIEKENPEVKKFNMIYNKNSPTTSGSEMNCRFEHKCS